MKQKEIIEKLESLEKEINSLKEKKQNKIHYLLLQIMEKYTKKQIFVFSIVFLFLLTLFAYAGTVTKNYTFSDGEIVSAAKFNANFDTLYTLVNGNLDDNNISGISASKITSGTLSGDRLDNISDSKIYGETIVFYLTSTKYNGNLGGRSGADAKCVLAKKNWLLTMGKTNVRAFMSISETDEIRDMVSNYNVPSTVPIISPFGTTISDNISDHLDGNINKVIRQHFIKDYIEQYAYTGSTQSGGLSPYNCANWTSTTAGNGMGQLADFDSTSAFVGSSGNGCTNAKFITCIAF